MNMRNLIIVLAIISVILVSGCTQPNVPEDPTPVSTDSQERCIELCREQIANGIDLSNGPCLSETDGLDWDIDDWVCDVAHEPRKLIDDNALHQCQEYRKERAAHFVEVTPNCEFIRKA
jgi:hypothetical protein